MPKRKILHSPTLQSVQMVERLIQKHSQEYGKYQLWKRLPKKMMYQTFTVILDYLQESGRIFIDPRDGIVMWTYNPEGIRKRFAQGLRAR